ncbi:hypothetical protein CYCD_17910 [Tenuifilaceae bacterium CYCD]|nr:hypothetical protein CYCD_17910 [Tenuifilaceae bacterium CYCD]
MEARSKEAILSKTHYGIGIYAHILRLYYPGETVLSLSGRTCSPTKNPFNADKSTLNIFIEKETVLGNALDKEFARHSDSENAIPAGDAFDFAELHYKQSGDELLQTLNRDMNLYIGENWSFYSQKKTVINTTKNVVGQVKNKKAFAFSFFKAPIKNTLPHKTVSLVQVYNAITGEYYKQNTEKLRSISDVVQARKYKAANFDYCTFSGVFTSRNDKSLVTHSELICIDFDHVQNIDTLRQALLADEYFDTQLLFISPSGDGLKWIIEIDTRKSPHGEYFASVANYILQTYSVEVDKSGKDISRACFIPFDPNAFINPLLLNKHEQENI